jgi:hypothetical protein
MSGDEPRVPIADLARRRQLLAEDGDPAGTGDLPEVDLDDWSWQHTLIVGFVIAAVADVDPVVALHSLAVCTQDDAPEPYGVFDYIDDALRAVDHARESRRAR